MHEWKEAEVRPIFKKKIRSEVGNRPVSLTSIVCKVMEKIIRRLVLQHMIANEFLPDYHHGFVFGRSCTTLPIL